MISVIVCTFNREKYLKNCLDHLADQNATPAEYEIVIINNNSPDNTESLCHAFIEQNTNLNITYHLEMKQGHTFARNAGIERSNGEILSFVDDDAFVHKDYVSEIKNAFKQSNVQAIGGKINPIYEAGKKPSWMSRYLLPLVSALDMGETVKEFKGTKHPIGANMAFRKSVFDEIGNFDVTLGRRGISGLEGGDEKEVFLRMKKLKMRLEYHPSICVEHIIGENRTTESYVKGLALGVGSSEKR
ncbi:MAG: glycosyltransferase, partial [Cyclobacteriaceae bacterium]